jgi:hypothetical protein
MLNDLVSLIDKIKNLQMLTISTGVSIDNFWIENNTKDWLLMYIKCNRIRQKRTENDYKWVSIIR